MDIYSLTLLDIISGLMYNYISSATVH